MQVVLQPSNEQTVVRYSSDEILSRFQACDDGRILPEVKSLQMRDAPARFKLRNLSLLSQERRADSFHTGSSRTQAVELRVESWELGVGS